MLRSQPNSRSSNNPLELPDEVGINFSGTISEAAVALERCLIREILCHSDIWDMAGVLISGPLAGMNRGDGN